MEKFLSLLFVLFASISLTSSNSTSVPLCSDGLVAGEANGNSEFLGSAENSSECIAMARKHFVESDSSYNAMSYGLEKFCYAYKNVNMTNGDPYIQTCLLSASTTSSESAIEGMSEGANIEGADTRGANIEGGSTDPGSQGDPIIIGLKGQVFKFEGTDGKWYSNLITHNLSWNMQFRKHKTCPKDEDMFISGMSIIDSSGNEKGFTSNILIESTPTPIPECKDDSAVCLGGGTLRISFDGGDTFVSRPGDYRPTPGSRLIAHNTYAACSRKWFDYAITKKKEKAARALRSRGRRAMVTGDEKTPLELLSGKNSTMIDPAECNDWIQKRKEKDDLFSQGGLWSTIYIETPLVSFHIEYRQSNPEKMDRACDFQSLDAWMSKVSNKLDNQEWNGILGETKKMIYDPLTEQQIRTDRSQLLRGKDDADYEVDGPFGLMHDALGYDRIQNGVPNTGKSIVVA